MWWTVFVLPAFYGESVEVLIHGSDLSYLSFVKAIVVSLSQERTIESIVTIVKIFYNVVKSFDCSSLIEVLHTLLVETVHTNYLIVIVSEVSNVILRNEGRAI
jgi:hypothetical protein